jgi:tetratricopeptide (TPR) repeat protein
MFDWLKRLGRSQDRNPPPDSKPGAAAAETEAAAWHERAASAESAGDWQAALSQAGHAVRLAPGCIAYRRQLAGILRQIESYQDAVRLLRDGLASASEEADEVLLEIGEIHLDAGDMAGAARVVDELAVSKAAFAAHLLAGLLAFRQKEWERARPAFEAAASLRPEDFRPLNGLGVVLLSLGERAEARRFLERAIAADPAAWQPYTNLALLMEQNGDLARAAELFEVAAVRNPTEARARFNAALLYLKAGDFRKGWEAYEARFQVPEIRHLLPQREETLLWDGSDPAGKEILVLPEQGYGDQIQFCRYLPLLAARGARVHYACQRELARLLASLAGGVELHPGGDGMPGHGLQCPLLSLPRLMGTDAPEKIPAHVPYLAPPADELRLWGARLEGHDGLRVGLVWASNNRDDPFRDRRVRLADLEPLWQVADCAFFSLQLGRAADEDLPAGVTDLAGDLHDFADTAAAMSALDLIISVDTAAAHLAGALALPVWLLVREDAEWRWMTHREDSPWYPSMKIFRRQDLQSWRDLAEIVATALAGAVAKRYKKSS